MSIVPIITFKAGLCDFDVSLARRERDLILSRVERSVLTPTTDLERTATCAAKAGARLSIFV